MHEDAIEVQIMKGKKVQLSENQKKQLRETNHNALEASYVHPFF